MIKESTTHAEDARSCRVQVERAKLEKAVEDELAAEAAADEEAKQQKREQIAAEERRLLELEEKRQAEVSSFCQAWVLSRCRWLAGLAGWHCQLDKQACSFGTVMHAF